MSVGFTLYQSMLIQHLPDLPLEDSLRLKILVLHSHPDHLVRIPPLHPPTSDTDSWKILVLAVHEDTLLAGLKIN